MRQAEMPSQPTISGPSLAAFHSTQTQAASQAPDYPDDAIRIGVLARRFKSQDRRLAGRPFGDQKPFDGMSIIYIFFSLEGNLQI
jgi:hypothetical protein